MAETNMGHIGDDIDAKAGDDPTLYGWRAAAETGRFSKHVAAQVYGSQPHHSYVWGGPGGGRCAPARAAGGGRRSCLRTRPPSPTALCPSWAAPTSGPSPPPSGSAAPR